ncbi:CRP-like cAMP-binding protein [Bosea sp. OAE506]|uniref:Crp/Fnr family transcriptional regulator n=1 Tax=Bosea sp. OAE506 TaxID=2663870 RepID=UPI001789749E
MGSPFSRKMQTLCALSTCAAAQLDRALRLLPPVRAGGSIVDDMDMSEFIHVILSGLAYRCRMTRAGGRQILAFHLAGDACDIDSLFVRAAGQQIIAASNCEVAMCSRGALLRLVDEHPPIAQAFWTLGLLEQAIRQEWLCGMGRMDALQRTGRLLCELHARADAVGLVVERAFPFPLSQMLFGDALGLSPVHMNRTLSALRKMGMASFHDGSVHVPDIERLRRFAEFDPAYLVLKQVPLRDGGRAQFATAGSGALRRRMLN